MDIRKDYYAVLGVLPSAEDVVIQGAYRALAHRYHPDRFKGDPAEAHRRMSEINEAYATLSNPAWRAEYDQRRKSLSAGMGDFQPADTADTHAYASFEVETFLPFAQKLSDWGYGQAKIVEVLVARGVRAPVAEHLARIVSDHD